MFCKEVTQSHIYSLITYSDLDQQQTNLSIVQLYSKFN